MENRRRKTSPQYMLKERNFIRQTRMKARQNITNARSEYDRIRADLSSGQGLAGDTMQRPQDKEQELAANQRRKAVELEKVESKLKEMGKKQKARLERREKLAGRESKLRRQLAEMEKRYLDIGLVLPTSQVHERNRYGWYRRHFIVTQQQAAFASAPMLRFSLLVA